MPDQVSAPQTHMCLRYLVQAGLLESNLSILTFPFNFYTICQGSKQKCAFSAGFTCKSRFSSSALILGSFVVLLSLSRQAYILSLIPLRVLLMLLILQDDWSEPTHTVSDLRSKSNPKQLDPHCQDGVACETGRLTGSAVGHESLRADSSSN